MAEPLFVTVLPPVLAIVALRNLLSEYGLDVRLFAALIGTRCSRLAFIRAAGTVPHRFAHVEFDPRRPEHLARSRRGGDVNRSASAARPY